MYLYICRWRQTETPCVYDRQYTEYFSSNRAIRDIPTDMKAYDTKRMFCLLLVLLTAHKPRPRGVSSSYIASQKQNLNKPKQFLKFQ